MKINKLIMLFSALAVFSGIFHSCEDETATSFPLSSTNFIGIEPMKSIEIIDGETGIVEVKVVASQVSNVDRVIGLFTVEDNPSPLFPDSELVTTMDVSLYNYPSTVTIPAGSKEGSFEVSILSNDLGGGKQLVIGIVPQPGVDIATSMTIPNEDGDFIVLYQNLVVKARELCLKNPFRVEISTDRYGEETSWELYDSSFNLIGSGGPYTQQASNGVYPQEPFWFCLEDGNYTFVIYDSPYSDGMNSGYGAGFYRLVKTVNGEEIEIAKNGTFGAMEEVNFSLP